MIDRNPGLDGLLAINASYPEREKKTPQEAETVALNHAYGISVPDTVDVELDEPYGDF